MKIFFSSLSGNERTPSLFFRRVLERMGHQVFYFSRPSAANDPKQGLWLEAGYPFEATFEALVAQAGFQPDVYIYLEPDGLIPRGMENASFPTACILSDTHRWLEARQQQARFFDHIFLFHRNYVKYFRDHPQGHVHWMPYACDLEVFHPIQAPRDLDLAFVGSLEISGERGIIIGQLADQYKINKQRFYYQREIPDIYSRAKMVLNLPLADDLNFRTFEALSCGSMLLTRRVDNGLEELFQEGLHYAAFSDTPELLQKVAYYLDHDDERETIAAAGFEAVRKDHSLDARLQWMLERILEHPEPVAPVRTMSREQVYRQYAWLYEYWRAPEAGLRLIRERKTNQLPWLALLPYALRSIIRGIAR